MITIYPSNDTWIQGIKIMGHPLGVLDSKSLVDGVVTRSPYGKFVHEMGELDPYTIYN